MKVRDLADTLERLQEADRAILDADTALQHGGCPETILWKEQDCRFAELAMEQLLEEDV